MIDLQTGAGLVGPTLATATCLDTSRRRLLRNAAYLAGGGALLSVIVSSTAAAADSKVAQKLANYQPSPKGAARCDNCSQFQAPSSCKVVQGRIAASGWCSLYAAKS